MRDLYTYEVEPGVVWSQDTPITMETIAMLKRAVELANEEGSDDGN